MVSGYLQNRGLENNIAPLLLLKNKRGVRTFHPPCPIYWSCDLVFALLAVDVAVEAVGAVILLGQS